MWDSKIETHPEEKTKYCQEVNGYFARTRKVTGDKVMLQYIRGHASAIAVAVSGGNPAWRNFGLTSGQVYIAAKKYKCPHCILNKRRRDTVQINERLPIDFDRTLSALNSRNAEPGEIISMDPNGPVTPATKEGYKLWYLFKDVATGYNHEITASRQDIESVKAATVSVFDWYQLQGCKPRILRVDTTLVTLSSTFGKWLADNYRASVESSVPYAHWQNAVERDVQTVLNGAATLLHAQHWLRADCRDLALRHYIDIMNRCPNSKCSPMPSLQTITKAITDLSRSYKFCFGELVAVSLPGNDAADQRAWMI